MYEYVMLIVLCFKYKKEVVCMKKKKIKKKGKEIKGEKKEGLKVLDNE